MKTNILLMTLIVLFSIGDLAESLDITKTAQGIIQEIKVNSVEILNDSINNHVWITVDPNTVYNNVQKLKDLKLGDKVQVEYQSTHGKNTAITVTKMEVES